jgi:hypothetical protein
MIDRNHVLPVALQARLVGISHLSVYYVPRAVGEADLALMRRIDELHLDASICRCPHACAQDLAVPAAQSEAWGNSPVRKRHMAA